MSAKLILFVILMLVLVISSACAGMFLGYLKGTEDTYNDITMLLHYAIKNKNHLDIDVVDALEDFSTKEGKNEN